MTTITFKINERTKAGKAFMTMKDTFFANANGIEIVEKTKKVVEVNNPENLNKEIELAFSQIDSAKSKSEKNKLLLEIAKKMSSNEKPIFSMQEIVDECNIVRKLRFENAK